VVSKLYRFRCCAVRRKASNKKGKETNNYYYYCGPYVVYPCTSSNPSALFDCGGWKKCARCVPVVRQFKSCYSLERTSDDGKTSTVEYLSVLPSVQFTSSSQKLLGPLFLLLLAKTVTKKKKKNTARELTRKRLSSLWIFRNENHLKKLFCSERSKIYFVLRKSTPSFAVQHFQ
jgi:hypothetical protein